MLRYTLYSVDYMGIFCSYCWLVVGHNFSSYCHGLCFMTVFLNELNKNTKKYFQMLTPSMFCVAAETKSMYGYEQSCLLFRMSDDKAVHKSKRNISEDVAEAIGGIPEGSELRVHVEAYDPKSSPQIYNGNDHLVFAVEDEEEESEESERWGRKNGKKERHCSKIYLVRFCLE